jgi:hypothetical protein
VATLPDATDHALDTVFVNSGRYLSEMGQVQPTTRSTPSLPTLDGRFSIREPAIRRCRAIYIHQHRSLQNGVGPALRKYNSVQSWTRLQIFASPHVGAENGEISPLTAGEGASGHAYGRDEIDVISLLRKMSDTNC